MIELGMAKYASQTVAKKPLVLTNNRRNVTPLGDLGFLIQKRQLTFYSPQLNPLDDLFLQNHKHDHHWNNTHGDRGHEEVGLLARG